MPLQPDESSGAPAPLAVQLTGVTQAFAAAQTRSDVLERGLKASLQALGAVAGTVLLIGQSGRRLEMSGHTGDDPARAAIWQSTPLDDHGPGADVIRTRGALYFDHAEALRAAYPELEAPGGAATAVLPMFLGGQPSGMLVVDFMEPHPFSAEEKSALRTVAAHCAVALDRVSRLELLGQRPEESSGEARAQEAFMAFSDAVGSESDLITLVQQAIAVLSARFPGTSVGYFEEDTESGRWKARVWSDDVSPELAAVISAGLPPETPMVVRVLKTRQPVFTDAWDPQQEGVDVSEEYGAVAGYPLLVHGELHWILTVALRDTRYWSGADRSLVRAVGRGLNQALERTQTARQLMVQNAELQARTRALEAFAELTRDLALTTDPLLLIRRAQEVVMSMLADGSALYYVLEGDCWFSRVQHGSLHSPELQAAVDAGLPYAERPNLRLPWTTGQPYFQDVHDQHADQLAPLVRHIGASATLPVRMGGQPIGVLSFVLFQQRKWSSVDRVLLETAVQNLELALDRAAKTRRLDEEREALEAFTRFTEAVGSEADVRTLVRQALALLADTCTADAVYLERREKLFRATVWSPLFDPALLARLQAGFPLKESSLALMLRENSAAFIDHWVNHREAAGLWIEESVHLQAVAGYPVFQNGEMQSVLLMGSRTSATWSERDKGIFRAVGRSLGLALDRALRAQELLEQRDALDARTQELAASTQDLEAFSYSVSHDLRTPVRHMLGFLQLTRKELQGQLNERAARYLDVVEQAGVQMNTLIDGLLNLSRASQQPLTVAWVDLNELMTQIQATLVPDLTSRNIRWEVSPLPSVQGDPDALKQVLTQLTENAVKFTRTRDPAVIRVWAEDLGGAWRVCVQDNGLGFDPRYQDRLFNLFQRLHRADEASGTGVGLASVQRLILKHGGQVFADGRLGEGALFGFTLPKGAPGVQLAPPP